ncbi:hypothetical protein PsorP6_000728 [Peronosclerospora sorghi]|uniref:Uncharacterized protein n=1 Tax=Peronosclerospora sorghi TaxID=230839 RepID=A0ACC0WY51_9STRA|nr:hypothetical protein PsorP6_000728 [Peronosclerospora sorghi]
MYDMLSGIKAELLSSVCENESDFLNAWSEIQFWGEPISVEAQVEWLRYFLKKALEDAEFSPDDAKVSEVVGAQPQSMDDLIKLWGLQSNKMVQEREGLLGKELGDVAKERVRNMAIGSVRLQQHISYAQWSKVSTSSDDELSSLLKKDDELLNALDVNPAVAKKYALWILDKEVNLPEIPVIIDMAIGGAYFKVFKERKAFKKIKIST